MLICRKRASCCPIFLLGRMPMPNIGSHSTFSSNAISVPGNRQTATCGSPIAAKPRVIELLNLVVTSLSSIRAGRVARGKFGVEAWGGLEERRVADALVNRKPGARNHLRCVFGGDQVRVLVLRPVRH